MATIDVTVPEDLKAFVDAEAAAGGFATSGDYVAALLKAWQQRAKGELEGKLIDGLDSGDPVEATPEFWLQFKDGLNQRASANSSAARSGGQS